MKKSLLLLILFILTFGVGVVVGWNIKLNTLPEPQPNPIVRSEVTSANLLETVNKWRVSQKLKPYIQSDFLCNVAKDRLPEIKKDFSHKEFHAIRWCTDCVMGENLAREYYSPNDLLNAWLVSPKHREVLSKDFTHSCVSTDGIYTVEIFGYF